MAWVKLDDGFADHPKVVEAGPMAAWLFVCGLTYCARQFTDGFIPTGQVRKLADLDNAMNLAATLVNVGLWERCDGGFHVHDYLDYNPSREQAMATRKVRAEAGSKGGKQKASNLLEASQSVATENPKQNSTPSRTRPVPVPDPPPDPTPEENDAPAAPVPVPKFSPVFEMFWRSYPSGHGSKVKTYAAWKQHGLDRAAAAEEREQVAAGLAAWKACERWAVKGMVKAAEIWVRDRWWADEPPPPDVPRAGPPRGKNNDPNAMFDLAQQYERQGL